MTVQVFVKAVPAPTGLLSGKVTSRMKDARLVQSGELVGTGVAGVAVIVGDGAGVSVAVGVLVGVPTVASVRVTVGVTLSVGAFPPHAESSIAIRDATTRAFLIMPTSSEICRNYTLHQFHC